MDQIKPKEETSPTKQPDQLPPKQKRDFSIALNQIKETDEDEKSSMQEEESKRDCEVQIPSLPQYSLTNTEGDDSNLLALL